MVRPETFGPYYLYVHGTAYLKQMAALGCVLLRLGKQAMKENIVQGVTVMIIVDKMWIKKRKEYNNAAKIVRKGKRESWSDMKV